MVNTKLTAGKVFSILKEVQLLLPATQSHVHYSNAKPTSTLLLDSVLQKRAWYTTIQFLKGYTSDQVSKEFSRIFERATAAIIRI